MRTGYVSALSRSQSLGVLRFGPWILPCALGSGGIRSRKREGDGATPLGYWSIEQVFYRNDQVRRPLSRFPAKPIRRHDGWCDAVGDRNYNRPVQHPYPVSAERMWRNDTLYSIVGVLSHNRCPRVQGYGSAVFLHEARDNGAGEYLPTAGCIALKRRDLQLVLAAGLERIAVL